MEFWSERGERLGGLMAYRQLVAPVDTAFEAAIAVYRGVDGGK